MHQPWASLLVAGIKRWAFILISRFFEGKKSPYKTRRVGNSLSQPINVPAWTQLTFCKQNSHGLVPIPTVALVNFIHILLLSVFQNAPGTVATWIVCLSARSEGRTWYTTHRGRLWIAATVKQPDPKEIRENEEFYRRLYGGRCRIVYTSLLRIAPLPQFLPSWNGESGMGNWKWELHSDGVIEERILRLYSSDIAT